MCGSDLPTERPCSSQPRAETVKWGCRVVPGLAPRRSGTQRVRAFAAGSRGPRLTADDHETRLPPDDLGAAQRSRRSGDPHADLGIHGSPTVLMFHVEHESELSGYGSSERLERTGGSMICRQGPHGAASSLVPPGWWCVGRAADARARPDPTPTRTQETTQTAAAMRSRPRRGPRQAANRAPYQLTVSATHRQRAFVVADARAPPADRPLL